MRRIWLSVLCLLALCGVARAQKPCPEVITPTIVPGTSYTVVSTDYCWWTVLTNAGHVTITLPGPQLIFAPGFQTTILPQNGATITFVQLPDDTGKIHKINGASSLTLVAGQGALLKIQQDMNWYAIPTGTGVGGPGTVTSITADFPIGVTPDPITGVGFISHADSGVTPGSYLNTNITVDEWGHVTAASDGAGSSFANPTATIGIAAVNGSTTTAMRSDAAPAIPQCSSGTFGACKVDNSTITASAGVISTPGGANPTATAGASAVNGTAATFMRSDGAPALTAATTSTAGIAKLNNVGYPAGWIAANDPNNAVVVTVGQASTITGIVGRVETPVGAAATVSVYKAPSGTACSAGTVLHSGSFNANGTAATNQTLTVTVSTLAAGDSICYVTTGTTDWTSGVGIGTITVFFAPS